MPGVPPNAFSKLKQALKGMLKPKKQQQQQQQQQQDQQAQQSQPEQQQQKQDKQQQQHESSTTSKPDVPPKLPPTHPLSTGQHSDKQIAVPLAGAEAGSVDSAPHARGSSIANAVNEQFYKSAEADNTTNNKAPVSPVEPTPITKDKRTVSEPVSAMSADEDKPLPVPKVEETATTVTDVSSADKGAETATAPPLPSQTAPQTSQPAATNENVKPNNSSSTAAPSTTAADASSKTEVPPTTTAAKVSSESSTGVVDEKMPVMSEEPPEIKTKAAAPGMSATSGPLDDYPLEGDKP